MAEIGYSAPPAYDQKGQGPEVNYGGYAPAPQHPPPMGFAPQGGTVIQSQPVGTTTVIVNQTQPLHGVRPWKSGLFDCFDDMGICLCGTFCGFCLVCQMASDMQESKCVACCVPAPVTALRTKWRAQNNIEGSILNDCILEAFCGQCAACQLAREIKSARLTASYSLQ